MAARLLLLAASLLTSPALAAVASSAGQHTLFGARDKAGWQVVMKNAFNKAIEEANADGDPSPGLAENVYMSHYPTFVRFSVNPDERPISGTLLAIIDDSANQFMVDEGMAVNASATILNYGYVARGTPFAFIKALNGRLYEQYWGEAQEL
jgi:hypothetical protein